MSDFISATEARLTLEMSGRRGEVSRYRPRGAHTGFRVSSFCRGVYYKSIWVRETGWTDEEPILQENCANSRKKNPDRAGSIVGENNGLKLQ